MCNCATCEDRLACPKDAEIADRDKRIYNMAKLAAYHYAGADPDGTIRGEPVGEYWQGEPGSEPEGFEPVASRECSFHSLPGMSNQSVLYKRVRVDSQAAAE